MKPVVVMTQTSKIQSDLVTIIHKPFIDIKPLEFDSRLLKDNYDWLIFSSKNAVKFFLPYMHVVNFKKLQLLVKNGSILSCIKNSCRFNSTRLLTRRVD